ncbi:MAG TPA: glycogen debranching N-terminal domain-containing protein [Actinomycetota bacterium]|jgi:glycogen debranching enzyme
MPEGGLGSDLPTIQVLDGSTFMLSDHRGDVTPSLVCGLFHEDTRYLNRFVLTVNGASPIVLSSSEVDYYSAAFFLTNDDLPGLPARSLSIARHRFVGGGLHERIEVTSHASERVTAELRLSFGADFADLFEVKMREFRKGGSTRTVHDDGAGELVFDYVHGRFGATTTVRSSEPGAVDGDDLVFELDLAPREVWRTRIDVSLVHSDVALEPVHEEFEETERQAGRVLRKWQDEVPRLHTASDFLEHLYQRSIVDLAALRLHAEVEGNDYSLPAAGLPWFMAIFGRDTIVTSFQSLLVGPELARGALHALAALQGNEVDAFKDEEPGKILHEIRFGELTQLGLKPHRPYYGTIDATPLWLILLHEYWSVTGDDACVRELQPNALRALEWIDRYGDRDGDGYVEYATRSSQGLRNQGWKDSTFGILDAKGVPAEPPIALCEVQGYVYDAKRRTAELAQRVWGDDRMAARLRAEADDLRDRFNRDFWVDADKGFYAVGLSGAGPGRKRVVDSLTSNMGQLLWTGIVPEERTERVVRHLFSKWLWSGWGVRTLAADNPGYNPISYHCGAVWPHDNSLISAGLYRAGYREEANRIALAMLLASSHQEFRLPEVFAGYERSSSRFPVRYPTASSPQAWATAAPFLWLRLILGIEARDGAVTCDPLVPKELGTIRYHGFHALGTHHDVVASGTEGEVTPTH